MASADETAVTELIIDASGALDGAQQFEGAVGQVEQASQTAAAATDKLSDSVDRSTTTVATSQRGLRQQKAALDDVAGSIAPVYAATQTLEKATNSASQAEAGLTTQMRNGAISVSEYNAAIAAIGSRKAQLQTTTQQLANGEISVQQAMAVSSQQIQLNTDQTGKLGSAYKLSYTDAEILRSGVTNVAQSLAAGMDPLQVFQTQLLQTAPAAGGLAASLGLSIGALAAFAAGVLLVGGLLIAGVAAAISYSDSQKALQNSLNSAGGVVGVNVAKLDDYANAAASAAHISVSSAQDIEAAYVSTGKVGADNIQNLIVLTGNLAHITGEDLAAAQKTVASAIQDPVKAAKDLTDQFGALTAAQTEQIRTLQAEGDQQGALTVLIDATNASLKNLNSGSLTDNLSLWQRIAVAVSTAYSFVGKQLAPASPQTLLSEHQSDLAAAQAQPGLMTDDQIAALQKQVAAEQLAIDAGQHLQQVQAAISADNRQAQQATDTANGVNTEVTSYNKLADSLVQLINFNEHSAQATDATRLAQQRLQQAVQTYQTPLQQTIEQTKIDTQVAGANAGVRDILRAKLEAQAQAQGQLLSPAEAEAKVTEAVTAATMGQVSAIKDRTDTLSLDAAGAVASAQAYLQGSVQGVQADAVRQASLEKLTNSQVNLTTATNQSIQDYVTKQTDAGSKTVTSLNEQVAASQVLLDASTKGTAAEHDAEIQNQITAQTRDLVIAKTLAQTDAEKALLQVLIDKTAADIKQNDVDQQSTSLNLDVGLEQQKLGLLEQQRDAGASLFGQQNDAVVLAQKELDLRRQYPDLDQQRIDDAAQLYLQEGKVNEQIKAQQDVMRTLTQGIQNLFENTFENVFEHGLKGFQGFGDQVIQLFAQVAAKIAEELIINAALNLAVSGSGGGGTAGTISTGVSAISTGSSLLSGGSSLGLLGSAGSSAFGGSGLGLGAAQGAGAAEGSSVVGGSSGVLGGAGSALGAVGGAAALGYGTSQVVGSVTGSHIAGNVLGGAAAGFLIGGPIGAVAGAAIGAIISAFQKPPQNNDGLAFIGSNHGNGTIHIAGVTSDHQDISGAQTIAAQEVTDVNAFAKAYGLKVNAPGSQDLGIAIGPNANPDYPQTEQASIAKLLQNHDFSSDNPAINRLLKSSGATDLNTLASQIGAITQGAAALGATLSTTGHAVSDTQTQMAQLGVQFETDKASAVTFGYTVGQVTRGYEATFNTSINDALLGIYNPEKLALAGAKADAQARYQTAKELGANILNVERVNQQDRLAIYEQYDGVTLAQLRTSLNATGHSVSDVQTSMAATVQTFEQATKAANDFNSLGTLKNVPTAAQVQTAYAGQFNTSLSDQLLAIQDPEKLALQQAYADAQARLAAAKKLGADMTLVEKLNAADRLAIIQQYADQSKQAEQQAAQQVKDTAYQSLTSAGSTLTDYIKSIQYGSNSALTSSQQFNLSKSQFGHEATLAANGNVAAIGDLSTYADAYLTQARTQYGTGAAYTQIYNQVVAALGAAGTALGGDAAKQNALMIAKATTNAAASQEAAYRQEMALLRQQMAQLIKLVQSGSGKPARLAA